MATVRHLLLALLAGGVVMVLEIVGPRLVAPVLGTDALTWTATIATFLGGLALGNVAGGRLADRAWRGVLPGLFALSAAVALLVPAFVTAAASATGGLAHGPRVFALVGAAFLPVAFVLGTIPPVLARDGLALATRPGLWLGLVGGAGALGSVAGTFFAGFHAVPTWGLRGVTLACAALLALGALFAPWRSPAPASRPSGGEGEGRMPLLYVGLAALAGAGILGFEILAGRMGSARLGSSIYTWTAVIGVVLAGLALGGTFGGILADRFRPRRLLATLLALASVATLAVLWTPRLLSRARTWADEGLLPWPTATWIVTVAGFLPAAILLGTISPVVIRAALGDPRTDGRTVGRLYAVGTLGAVLGAVLTGSLLIPLAGLERMTLFLAFAFASASGIVRRRQPYLVFGLLLVVAALIHGPWPEGRRLARRIGLPVHAQSLHLEDSRYARIRVQPIDRFDVAMSGTLDVLEVARDPLLDLQAFFEEDEGRLHWRGGMTDAQRDRLLELGADAEAVARLHGLVSWGRRLRLDRLVHGYVHLEDPAWLGYGYERLYAAVLAHVWPDEPVVDCFFIGGGAYAFQRHLLATHGDGVRCLSAEIDPRVTAVAREWLGLADDPRHEIVHADARTALQEREGRAYDLVFGDAFDHIAVPFHLTTHEFAQAMKARMAPDGIYLANVIDAMDSGLFLGSLLHTLRQSFQYVHLVCESPDRNAARDTFVVVATDADLGLEAGRLRGGPDGVDAWVVGEDVVERLVAGAGRRVLTDDDAPVEVLLAPVVYVRPR